MSRRAASFANGGAMSEKPTDGLERPRQWVRALITVLLVALALLAGWLLLRMAAS